jgi:hypothetical protein
LNWRKSAAEFTVTVFLLTAIVGPDITGAIARV